METPTFLLKQYTKFGQTLNIALLMDQNTMDIKKKRVTKEKSNQFLFFKQSLFNQQYNDFPT